jgi:truncated hemoglobin YjbI
VSLRLSNHDRRHLLGSLLERNDVSVRPTNDRVVAWNGQEPDVQRQRLDIADRRDVACLVNVFYDRVRDDGLLGPIFDDVAHVNWATHLPRMYDFWESVLFGTATFKGMPLIVHRALARRTPIKPEAFDFVYCSDMSDFLATNKVPRVGIAHQTLRPMHVTARVGNC